VKARAFEAPGEREIGGDKVDREITFTFSLLFYCFTAVIEYVGFSHPDFPMLARMRELATG
jgi:hypothetical protein